MFTSAIGSGEFVIDDSNYQQLAPAQDIYINGELKTRGHMPRDYEKEPFASKFAAFDLPLIPRSEWPERIEEMERTGSSLSQLMRRRGIPVLDQNGTNYCASADTEVLTSKGWVLWPEYNGSDLLATVNPLTHLMEFQAPSRFHVYEHKGEMVVSTNRRVDFSVTPDHRMYVRKWDERARTLSNSYQFVRAADLGWYTGLMHAPAGHLGVEYDSVSIDGDRRYSGDDIIAMLSLVVSDGWAGGAEKTRNTVSFACFKDGPRRKAVAELAQRIGFREVPSRPGVWARYDAPALAAWIRANCYSSDKLRSEHKKVPGFIKYASGRQIRHFLAMYGDQAHGMEKGHAYFSTSKQAVDDIQELLLRVGKRGAVWQGSEPGVALCNGKQVQSRHRMWHVHEASEDRLCLDRKKHLERDSYNGLVYCATVPNSTLITRRNGTVLISGNCWINAPTWCVMVIREKANLPNVRLSPASVGSKIKNFRNVGGWGTEGLEYITRHGVVPQELWPANAISRQYDTPAAWDVAKNYVVTEWSDLQPRNLDQMATCLLYGIPVAIGLNWWGHEVTAMDLVLLGSNDFGIRIANSWGEGWSDGGYGILKGSKMLPDDAVAPRVAVAA